MTGFLRTLEWGLPLCLVLAASPAGASQFTVNPTRVELSARVPSAVVSLRNDGQGSAAPRRIASRRKHPR